jgi:DNA-binding response OmpR family regulator
MPKSTVLIIEDEKNIVELVKYNFEQHGYRVLSAADGRKGFESALRDKPDVILLDLMLPEMNGLQVCRELRQNYKTQTVPVLMLTAKSEEADVVLGLELGADDYVTKPFSTRQLLARVKALVRRSAVRQEQRVIRAGAIEMDTARHQVQSNGRPVELTSREFSVLKLLLESGGRVLSRELILNEVWGQDESLDVELRVVDKHVGELRRKLKAEAFRIVTVKNFGYRLDLNEEE